MVEPGDPGAFVLGPLSESERVLGPRVWLSAPRLADLPLGAALAGRSDGELRAAALVLIRTLAAPGGERGGYPRALIIGAALSAIGRRRLAWTPDEASTVVHEATYAGHHHVQHKIGGFVASVLEGAGGGPAPDAVATYQELLAGALRSGDAAKLVQRLRPFAPTSGAGAPVDLRVVSDGDGWGRAVRALLEQVDDPAGVGDLLHHLATSATRPSQRWLSTAEELVAAAPAAPSVLRAMLAAVPEHELRPGRRWERPVLFDGGNAELVRGAAFALASSDPTSVALLGEAAVHAGTWPGGTAFARNEKVANGCVAALGLIGGDDAVAGLTDVRQRVKNRNVRKRIERALEAAATAAGLDVDELVERVVPRHDLGPGGCREVRFGEDVVRVTVDGDKVKVKVKVAVAKPGGGWAATVPARLRADPAHAEALAELRTLAKEATKTLATEKLRVESLLAADRSWPLADWARLYRDHPLTGVWTARLLWAVSDGDGGSGGVDHWTTVRVVDGGFVDLAGEPVVAGAGAPVRLWHPIGAPPAEVEAWRGALTALEVRQPFKQAWREVYLLTSAEEATGTYSNRFAAHILRFPQAYALMKTRDWAATALGRWDGGYEGTATKVFPGGRWRAAFFYELAELDDHADAATLCATDQVRFEQLAGGTWEVAPLPTVPRLVFSEAMRDVDLFVGVTSIAADPEWTDRGGDRHLAYWRETSFGELTESAATRRTALEHLLPRTKIADRVAVDGRFLRVRGRLRTYKIHIGSGNILMEPNDQYLCIVPERAKGPGRIFLPFEQDGGRLSLIVSKALLLADDHEITDPTILTQITPT